VKITNFLSTVLLGVAAGAMLFCNIETASGPTPYLVFNGNASSTSYVSCGKGIKTYIIPAGLVMTGIGQWVTITPTKDTTVFMSGTITSYDRNSGTLTVTITETNGFETYHDWKIVSGKTNAVVDSVRQAYTNLKFGMFLHFNMSTFDRCCCPECYSVSGEWGLANRDPKLFNPTKLNCGQWADVAKSAGCTYMVLVTKHHDGFCNWPTKYTNYCVTNAGVTRDVVREFVDSARSRGIRVGFYYSIRDLTNGFSLSFIKGQLSELLTNYGNDIICLWFDGWGWGPGYNRVPYDTVRNLIKSIQPNCLIVENNHEFTTVHSEIIEYEMPIDGPPKLGNIRPAEGNEPIRADQCWFWHPNRNCDIQSAQSIVDQLNENNSRNASYLLDLTPDTTGLIPDCQAARMKEVGQLRGVPQQ
jgi:alpha-L-fucosidase